MKVPVGMLGDNDRLLIRISKGEQIPIVVASLHACVLMDGWTVPECIEPWHGQGLVSNWDGKRFFMALDDRIVAVPWRSAVQVWRPDQVPSLHERVSIVRMYSHGSVKRVHE